MQTIVLVLCYIVLILLFSSAYNTSLIYCFVIWCLHTNKRRPCSSTLSGHPSSSVAFCFNYYFCWWGGLGWGGMLTFMLRLMMLSWSWGGVGWDVNVHVTLMMLRWSWGGVGWDVNVHVMLMKLRWSWGGVGWGGMLTFMLRYVALMMLRSEKSCRFWNNRPTGRYSNMCCPFVYFNTNILGLLAQKPSTARTMGEDPKFKASSKGLLLSMLMVLVHGPKLRRFWKFLFFKRIISRKNMLPQFVKCPLSNTVEHRPLIQIGNRWSVGFPRKLPKKKALVTWWPNPHNWSKGSGNGCGAGQSCAAIIQRNLQPWANCSMVEVAFGTSKNRRASLLTQFQWEIHERTLKTTRRLSAPFPYSYMNGLPWWMKLYNMEWYVKVWFDIIISIFMVICLSNWVMYLSIIFIPETIFIFTFTSYIYNYINIYIYIYMDHRRKFRSQTSDNMDRWKAEQGRGREKRKIRRKKGRSGERARRKKMQMREKEGNTTLHDKTRHVTTLHYTTFHYLPLHYTTQHCTTLPSTTFRYLPLHSTPLHSTLLHYTTLHWMTLHHR